MMEGRKERWTEGDGREEGRWMDRRKEGTNEGRMEEMKEGWEGRKEGRKERSDRMTMMRSFDSQ